MDESKFVPFYQEIANQLDEIVPGEYIFSGKIPDDYGVDEKIFFKLVFDLSKKVQNLKKEFIKQNQREWKVLTLYLKNDFTFRAEYSYEIDEEVGRYEREIYWAYETLDIVPKDDFDKKILDEYLQHK